MPTYTSNYNLILPLPLSPLDANIWGPMVNSNTNFQDSYSLSLANNFIGTSQPTIPATSVPATGQFWINNTTSGSWPVQLFDGASWVSIGILNNIAHTFTPAGAFTLNYIIMAVSGTYTPSSTAVRYVFVEVIGGGGGGGAGLPGPGYSAGGGGGSGGVSSKFFAYSAVAAGITVTVGAGGIGATTDGGNGGDTTFGVLMTGKGGTGGLAGAALTVPGVSGLGGAGGAQGTGGSVTAIGAGGTCGLVFTNDAACGVGGASIIGGNRPQTNIVGNGGTPTGGYAAGGNGGIGDVSTNGHGGAGAGGIVLITEYT